MKNTKQLRDELVKLFNDVKKGKVDNSTAKNQIAATNAMLKSAQLELEQNKLLGQKVEINFLKTDQTPS